MRLLGGGRGLHAARRSPPWRGGHGIPGCVQAVAAGRAGLQRCRRLPERGRGAAGGAARQLLRPGRLRYCVRGCAWVWTCVGSSAAGGPSLAGTLRPAAACAAPTSRVCAATQLARGPRPPGLGQGRTTLPTHWARGGGGSGTEQLLLRLSETWCPQGLACVTELRPGRRGEGLVKCRKLGAGAPSPSLSSVHGKVDMETTALGVWGQRCRGGEELGQVH